MAIRTSATFLLRVLPLLLLAGASILISRVANAEHEEYRFKWPYAPGVSQWTTTLPFATPNHVGDDAWDIDIGAGDDVNSYPVINSAEGLVEAFVYNINPDSCDPAQGLGNYVQVRNPSLSGELILTYAHLASTPLRQLGARVLQGDSLGIQGHTGATYNPQGGCGTHLHWEFERAQGPPATPQDPAHPSAIDGQSVTNQTNGGHSTNSVVGAYNAPGAAIRTKYFERGSVYTSWATIGWTADWTGTGAGCGSQAYCRLYTHYFPDPLEGHWGSKQDFRKHPDGAGLEYTSIMTGRWAVNDAYTVWRPFYVSWLLGGENGDSGDMYAIGPPLIDQVGSFPGLCDVGVGCVEYQRFHVGYVWKHHTQGYKAVFCPDVPSGSPAVRDGFVGVGDIFAVVGKFGVVDTAQPFEPWQDAAWSILGEGTVSVGDLRAVTEGFGPFCYPTE